MLLKDCFWGGVHQKFGVKIKSFPIARWCPETFHRTSHPRRYLLGPVLRKKIPWNLVNKNYTPEWLTWNLNMFSPARGDSFWKTIMFRFHVNFPGRICGCFFHGWSLTSQLSWNTQFFLMASRQTKRKMMKMVCFFCFFSMGTTKSQGQMVHLKYSGHPSFFGN